MAKTTQPGREAATNIALKLLEYMAADGASLMRFMELTGLGLEDVKRGAVEPGFQAGLLDYVLSDESLLVAFATNEGLNPATILQMRSKLPGFAF